MGVSKIMALAAVTMLPAVAGSAAPTTGHAPSPEVKAVASPSAQAPFLTAQQFESQIVAATSALESQGKRPDGVERDVLQRLAGGYFVTDATVESLISALDSYETRPGGSRYSETDRVIEAVLPYTYGRSTLLAALYGEKAHIFQVNGDLADADTEYATVVGLLTPAANEIEEQRVGALLEHGNVLFAQGNKKAAEAAYLDVLCFDWTVVRDQNAFRTLKGMYIQAGLQLIQCRRFDLKALQVTYFFDSAMDQLGPALNQALMEAGGKARS